MDGSILAATLGCIGAVAGSALGVVESAKKTNFRLEQLEKKMDKHNNLVERMVAVEERCKSNTHRLDELQRG